MRNLGGGAYRVINDIQNVDNQRTESDLLPSLHHRRNLFSL
jgi:hypothetical protein